MLEGLQKQNRENGEVEAEHKAEIPPSDTNKLYQYFNDASPWRLLHKIYFEVSYHFIRRGREGLRDLTPKHFSFGTDSTGKPYVDRANSEVEKKKQGNEKVIVEKQATMYATGEAVKSLRKYILYLQAQPGMSRYISVPNTESSH